MCSADLGFHVHDERHFVETYLFFYKQKTAYDIEVCLEFRRVLFRSDRRPSRQRDIKSARLACLR